MVTNTWFRCLWCILGIAAVSGNDVTYGVRDFCEGETFKAKCDANQVIIMREAIYGRMRLGRCVKVDMGYMGCHEDVRHLADGRCSGKQECEISIPDPMFERTQPCLELKSYLEASYSCLNVIPVNVAQCRKSRVMRVTASSGYIASALSYPTWCGTTDTPWLIEALPGQRVNITLMDFAHSPEGGLSYGDSFNGVEVCQKYAVIREEIPERSTVICGGRAREMQVYLSNSNAVRIGIEARSGSKHHFVLKYEVQGCPDPDITSNTWFKRENNEITIGCKDTDEIWHVTCKGTKWIGVIGNCSRGDRPISSEISIGPGLIPRKIIIVTVCGIAFVVGVLILMIGIFFFRKFKQRPQDIEQPQTTAITPKSMHTHRTVKSVKSEPGRREEEAAYLRPSGDKIEVSKECRRKPEDIHTHTGSPMYQKGLAKNDYTHIWEMPLPTPEDSG